ncbi:MAG: ATP-binding cassette domain-containing protein, partial [Planctomycetota bacterium]
MPSDPAPAASETKDTDDIVLECRDVSHAFGTKKVLNGVNLKIGRGQIVALVGPSGSGKSTLLRAILGTHPPNDGQLLMNGKPYREPHRDRGIVYQRYSLFPFLTAEENVAFGPMLDQTSIPFRLFQFPKWRAQRKDLLEQAGKLLDRVGLSNAKHQYPSQLSGGMCQRVAIAQALIMRPKLLLLDEPFGALDEATRESLQLMLLQLYEENTRAREAGLPEPHTILIVTHELNEALYVSDRILGLSQYHHDGIDGATIVYDKPAPIFKPHEEKDLALFQQQKEVLLQAVFSEDDLQHHSEFVSYWMLICPT